MFTLPVQIAKSPDEAPNYKETIVKGAILHSAVVVLGGTTSGKPTVDLRFEVKGKAGVTESVYVAMTTGETIKALANVIIGLEKLPRDPGNN